MDKTIGGVAASAHINNIIIITRKREVFFSTYILLLRFAVVPSSIQDDNTHTRHVRRQRYSM